MKIWYVVTLLCWVVSIHAASPTATHHSLSFSQAREIILSRNAGLKSAQTEIDAARAGVAQADTRPNPGIGVELNQFGTREIEAGVEQELELGGKRRLRTKAAQKEVDAAANSREITRLALEAEIVRRFIPIATTTRKLVVVDSILKITEVTRDMVQRRVDAGASPTTDLVRLEIDIEQLRLEHSEIRSRNHRARLQFAALGADQDSVLMNVAGELQTDIPIPDLATLQRAVHDNPAIGAYTIEQARLETKRQQLRADVVPSVHLSAGFVRNNAENDNAVTLGLSMPIPLFDRNSAAQKRAELELQASSWREENAYRLLMADIHEIHGHLQVLEQRLHSLRGTTIPKAQQVHTMVQEYYQAGNADFLALTEAQAEVLRLKLELIDTQQTRALALADLMQNTATHIQVVQ